MADRPGRRDLLFWVPRATLAMGTVGWAAIAVRAATGDQIQVGAFVAFAAVAFAALPLVVLISLRPASTARRLRQRRRMLPESVLMFVGVPFFMSGSALQDAVGATLSKADWTVLVSAAILCGASGSLAVLTAFDSIAHADALARSGG